MRHNLYFEVLTPNMVHTLGNQLEKIGQDQPDEYWTEAHFLVDLPEKWNLSFVGFLDSQLIGYAVMSRKHLEVVHLHHFMLHPTARGLGLGRRFMAEAERRASQSRATFLTLKVNLKNIKAERFYKISGYKSSGQDEFYRLMVKTLG